MIRARTGLFALPAIAIALALTACGGGTFSDLLVENPGAQSFLDRVARDCGRLTLGNRPIDDHLEQGGERSHFVDETTKLYFGKVKRNAYVGEINARYPSGRNQPAIDCIFAQLRR